jgi:glutamate-ammonia-ligase adenylyltransferase
MWQEFSAIPFQDSAKAEANLARLELQLAPGLMPALASLLSQSPDPDGALNLLERYAEGAPPEVLGDLARHPTALTYLVAIFGYSVFLAETFLAEPELPVLFARDRNFTKLKSKEDLMQDFARFATTSPDHWLSAQLARFKRRNYLRIVLKDVLHLSTLGETTLELSSLADVILTNTLLYCDQELEKRYGQPQYRDAQGRIVRSGFSILSLGKLGGNELNYSSDVDLLFLYSHDGETGGGNEPDSVISNKEYFVALARAITRTITQVTPHGLVFRVDLRLRPEGEQGDLAISLKSAAEYYEHRARDWELQMLIKARHSAGDALLTREFLREVEPYIYRSPADFEAIESVLWAREKISQKLRESRGEAIDVKLHRGGIRDIEFLTQCLQRLHGGRDPWVRSGGTLFALRKLNDKGWLSDRDYAALTSAYEFLRKLEHRVQLEMGQQTHRLPGEPAALDRLARRAGVEPAPGSQPGEALQRHVEEAFACVDEIYQRVVHPRRRAAGSDFDLKPLPDFPGEHSFHSYDAALDFLAAQAPELAERVREVPLPERTRKNVTRLFAALFGSSERFGLAREDPDRLRRAIEVVESSEYLAELLIHHPEDVAALDAVRPAPDERAAPAQLEMVMLLHEEHAPLPWVDDTHIGLTTKMALLRRYYRSRVLEYGAGDLAAMGSVFAALDRWSALAARCVASAMSIAVAALGPNGGGSAPARTIPLMVLGLGRLGLREFDLASDADLVFVAAKGTPREEIPHWTRLAEKTIEVLSSYTRDGMVFAVDTRLRPRGQEGELVVTEEELLSYFAESAHVWEALTYLKAFPVGGSIEQARELVARLSAAVMERFAAFPKLEDELQEMRRRLEREVFVPPSNTKTAPGGYYDIDFALSFLRLRHRVLLPPGANTLQQISALRSAGVISEVDANQAATGAAFLRSVDHAIRLVTGKAAEGLPEKIGHAETVENQTRRWGLIGTEDSLAARLREVQQQIRYVYRRLVGAE